MVAVICNSANHAISGETFCKLCRFPRSEIFYPTLGEEEGWKRGRKEEMRRIARERDKKSEGVRKGGREEE